MKKEQLDKVWSWEMLPYAKIETLLNRLGSTIKSGKTDKQLKKVEHATPFEIHSAILKVARGMHGEIESLREALTKDKTPSVIDETELNEICEIGSGLHTALRKYCDSKATSILYNLVSLSDEAWMFYLEFLYRNDVMKAETREDLIARVRKLSLADWDLTRFVKMLMEKRWTVERVSEGSGKIGSALNAYQCTMEMFDDGDWDSYTYLLCETLGVDWSSR